ncbi:hypothetical protein Pmani_014610 [Petrolisthes manimaculis]|uniref:Protein adenylyltransferase Fic n=1 Tax=Petrolisthes manimaculis TaxID=1843537 RepID=A0AAE1PCQ4_9EUCA|nr:hypothetical protein Pmani_023290 [Petrolisthes manimaculis]KAK4314079.1 hypothetical protein Pmani_014610 [Petrolisthes manimaculis]
MDDGYVAMALIGAHDGQHAISKKQTTELEDNQLITEALNTVKAARELAYVGKSARAGRLLEHALSLAPKHPEVLIHYGEYLEQHRKDVVQADKIYLRALAVSPANSRALRNRRRTQPLVDEMDSDFLSRIDAKRDDLARIPSSSAALRRIKKEAYFHHVYHTAGLEGNTMTLAQTRSILETKLSVGGKSIIEHNEILGLDAALKFINTTLVHRVGRIALHDILEIHRRVLGHVDPIEAGHLRTTQVYVSEHVPPPPTRLQVLMEEFISWLNSPQAQSLHPVKYAALAHYKLVFIHPFSDGNGRTARLLMNFLLMQAGYPPVIIRKQDRLLYYECLKTANEGDTRPFIRFIAHCTEKTLDVYLWATREAFPKIGQEMHSTFKKRKRESELRREAMKVEEKETEIKREAMNVEEEVQEAERKNIDNEEERTEKNEKGENSEDSESEGKAFIFDIVEDTSDNEHEHIAPQARHVLSSVEDDILGDEERTLEYSQDESFSSQDKYENHEYYGNHEYYEDYRPHLWFLGEEEEKGTVVGGGWEIGAGGEWEVGGGNLRHSRILDERSIYADSEILERIRRRQEEKSEGDVDYFPRGD